MRPCTIRAVRAQILTKFRDLISFRKALVSNKRCPEVGLEMPLEFRSLRSVMTVARSFHDRVSMSTRPSVSYSRADSLTGAPPFRVFGRPIGALKWRCEIERFEGFAASVGSLWYRGSCRHLFVVILFLWFSCIGWAFFWSPVFVGDLPVNGNLAKKIS